MIFKIFTVYDQKAHAYLPIFCYPEQGQAVRTFTDCVNSTKHQFGNHPADYNLYCIGEFDDQTGNVDNYEVHKSLGNGIEFSEAILGPSLTPGELPNEIGDEAPVPPGT